MGESTHLKILNIQPAQPDNGGLGTLLGSLFGILLFGGLYFGSLTIVNHHIKEEGRGAGFRAALPRRRCLLAGSLDRCSSSVGLRGFTG